MPFTLETWKAQVYEAHLALAGALGKPPASCTPYQPCPVHMQAAPE